MTNNEIKCVICDKVLGKLVLDGSMNGGKFLGNIPMYHQELDYRKSSHCLWKENKKYGHLCRKCAKLKFTEGKSYRVMFKYHGKDTSICTKYPNDVFLTRKEAEAKCDEMNEKNNCVYWIEEDAI